jgi:hypothetical protein
LVQNGTEGLFTVVVTKGPKDPEDEKNYSEFFDFWRASGPKYEKKPKVSS